MTNTFRRGLEGDLQVCIGREGTAGKVSGLGGALMLRRKQPGAEGQEERSTVAGGCIFRKRDS